MLQQRLSLVGTLQQRLSLVGTLQQRLSVVGDVTTTFEFSKEQLHSYQSAVTLSALRRGYVKRNNSHPLFGQILKVINCTVFSHSLS